MYHLLSCLRKIFLPLYRHFSDFKSHCEFFLNRWCGLHNFPSLRRVFCVLNHKYIKWKCFLGIL